MKKASVLGQQLPLDFMPQEERKDFLLNCGHIYSTAEDLKYNDQIMCHYCKTKKVMSGHIYEGYDWCV